MNDVVHVCVCVRARAISDVNVHLVHDATTTENTQLVTGAEALVLVFDAHDTLSFEDAMILLERQGVASTSAAEVRLVVGVVDGSGADDDDDDDATTTTVIMPKGMGSWARRCRMAGFEMVVVADTGDESFDDSVLETYMQRVLRTRARADGKEEEELDMLLDCYAGGTGFRRVIEALQAHYWPCLVLKDRGSGGDEHENGDVPRREDEDADARREETSSARIVHGGDDAVALSSSSLGVSRCGRERFPTQGTSSQNGTTRDDTDCDDDQDDEAALEHEMAVFEKMMAAVARARTEAMAADKDGDDDGEGMRRRREIAADVAMQMLDQLGLGDIDDVIEDDT